MAKTVFRPGETKNEEKKVLLPLVYDFSPIEEEPEEIVEEYTGPTADDLRREAEAFQLAWEHEKQLMLTQAQAEADAIVKKAEDAAFAEVKKQTDDAQIIKADAENEAFQIIQKAKQEAEQIHLAMRVISLDGDPNQTLERDGLYIINNGEEMFSLNQNV